MEHYDDAPGRRRHDQRLGRDRPPNFNSGWLYYFNFSPLVFILCIEIYAFYTLISLFTYLWSQRGSKSQAILELFLSCFLTLMAVWSLLSAVFTHPGKPGAAADDEEAYPESRQSDFNYGLDEISGAGDENQSGSSSHGPPIPNQQDHLQEGEGDHDDGNDYDQAELEIEDQDNLTAPLLSSSLATNLPLGQPKYPARSGRSQLNQIKNLTRKHTSSTLAGSAHGKGKGKSSGRGKGGNLMVKSNGTQRWCKKCNRPKPDRCHHCSSCGTCVLRMDHHCPWLASRCVGLRNHKAFFLFLMYTALLAIYTAQEMARALLVFVEREIDGFENSPITWAISLFMGFIFGMALLPFGLYHLYLILKNRTTIESMEGSGRIRIASKSNKLNENGASQPRMSIEDRLKGLTSSSSSSSATQPQGNNRRKLSPNWKPDEYLTKAERKMLKRANKLNIYNVGALKNWKFIMGENWAFWFFPIGKPDCDGIEYEINEETLRELRRITKEVRGGVESREEDRNPRNDYGDDDDDEEEEEEQDDKDFDEGKWNKRNLNRISSTRSSIRSSDSHFQQKRTSSSSSSFNKVDVDLGRRPEPESRRKGSKFKSAHGEVEWGEPPKRDFVLFGVDSDEDEDEDSKSSRNRNSAREEDESKDISIGKRKQDLQVEDPWS